MLRPLPLEVDIVLRLKMMGPWLVGAGISLAKPQVSVPTPVKMALIKPVVW